MSGLPVVSTSRPGEWDAYLAGDAKRGPSHVLRSTTSSRKPGRKIEGVVVSAGQGVATCPDCGGLRFALGGVHAPRIVRAGGRFAVVDCAGREVLR